MKPTFYLLFAGLLLNAGCNQTPQAALPAPGAQIIDFDNAEKKEIKLSTLASSISYIPLETNDSVLLSTRLYAKINKSYILVWSNTTPPTLFDINGRYLSQVREYENELEKTNGQILECFIDTTNRSFIYCNGTKWYGYSFDGELKDTTDLMQNLRQYTQEQTKKGREETDDDTKTYICGPSSLCVMVKGIPYVSKDRGKNFRKITEDPIIPGYVFDNPSTAGILHVQDINVLSDSIGVFDYSSGCYKYIHCNGAISAPYFLQYKHGFCAQNGASLLREFWENKRHFFIKIDQHRYLYDKMNGTVTEAAPIIRRDSRGKSDDDKDYYFKNDIDPGMDFELQGVTAEGELFGYIGAERFRVLARENGDPKLVEIAGKVKDGDNQVLIIAHIETDSL